MCTLLQTAVERHTWSILHALLHVQGDRIRAKFYYNKGMISQKLGESIIKEYVLLLCLRSPRV